MCICQFTTTRVSLTNDNTATILKVEMYTYIWNGKKKLYGQPKICTSVCETKHYASGKFACIFSMLGNIYSMTQGTNSVVQWFADD